MFFYQKYIDRNGIRWVNSVKKWSFASKPACNRTRFSVYCDTISFPSDAAAHKKTILTHRYELQVPQETPYKTIRACSIEKRGKNLISMPLRLCLEQKVPAAWAPRRRANQGCLQLPSCRHLVARVSGPMFLARVSAAPATTTAQVFSMMLNCVSLKTFQRSTFRLKSG